MNYLGASPAHAASKAAACPVLEVSAGGDHRPEIDGLRAVAVIPVILFHAGFAAFGGGFIGVDVFFVISGFLITSIIQRELQAGTFSVIQFYERRARRILPALFFVMLLCLPGAWFWMLPHEAAASLVASQWALERSTAASFFLAPFRAWELLSGALLALAGRHRILGAATSAVWIREAAGVLAMALILVPVFMVPRRFEWKAMSHP